MPQKPIRVLLVDDSPLALAVLQRLLAAAAEIEVVGTASNGREALELIPRLQPALVCTDYHMPQMDGWN
jgi:two-component system chemotaxis response regulator CheB